MIGFIFFVVGGNVDIETIFGSKSLPTVFAVVLKQGWIMNAFNMLHQVAFLRVCLSAQSTDKTLFPIYKLLFDIF